MDENPSKMVEEGKITKIAKIFQKWSKTGKLWSSNMKIVKNGTKGVSNDQQWLKMVRKSHELKWGASSRWSVLHYPMRNTDEMTIGKVHPTLTSNQKPT